MSDNAEKVETPAAAPAEEKAAPSKAPSKKKVVKKVVKKSSSDAKESKSGKKVKKVVKKATTKKADAKAATKTKKATTTKKASTAAKPTKKTTTKKAATTKKATKATTKKVTKKAATKKKTDSKKKTESTPKAVKFNKFETWTGEAIAALQTEDKQWVSYARIKQYLVDYMDKVIPAMIPKMTKKALLDLTEKKLLKKKKESYSFTSKGKAKLQPEKIEKRKKIDRPVKKAKVVAPEPAQPAKEVITLSGRVSKPAVRE
ncbi:hypothetical protein TRFO_18137 [Tritrichomonas foetus]|uniref:H15 domain-containing protein n=1 Tax=Tritrichomonas foetus TaxID=1144522 RepID=A0A1J4KRD2_9EUKA|nr:hypothetical protein TRFO_18137 [Tritrichomonas foetus]|eukprot:OHT12222.1 hypothetical protein TRFO_18137 [Tritrichomonas foetus]